MDDGIYPSALPSGTRIGATVLQRAIGQGAWGIVYAGMHDVWGKVAVKEYCPSQYSVRSSAGSMVSTSPRWQDAVRRGLEKFRAEGLALRKINHPGVVRVIDMIEAHGTVFLVMDFIEGKTLSDTLNEGRIIQPDEVVGFTKAILSVLEAIHDHGVIHRDISPDNIMLTRNGDPILIDFGGAAAVVGEATSSSSSIIKDGYSPPEQYDGEGASLKVGPWSDIYAAGAVLYRMVSGTEPPASNHRLMKSVLGDAADPMTSLLQLAPRGYSTAWLAATQSALELFPNRRPQSVNAWREHYSRASHTRQQNLDINDTEEIRTRINIPNWAIIIAVLIVAASPVIILLMSNIVAPDSTLENYYNNISHQGKFVNVKTDESTQKPTRFANALKKDSKLELQTSTKYTIRADTYQVNSNSSDYYPENAKINNIEGDVLLRAKINSDKTFYDCVVLKENPKDEGFGEAALNICKSTTWDFTGQNISSIEGKVVEFLISFKVS